MSAGQIHDSGLARGNDELMENLRQGQGPLRVFRGAVRPGAQNNAGAVGEFSRVAQLGQHAVDAVGLFANVLQEQDFALAVNLPGSADGIDQQGKVAAAEDDPRNPATIADNVGDNVGDVAGMGADLYESYCGSILSTAALGATAFAMNGDMQLRAVIAPMVIAAIGIFLSLIGIFLVRTKEGASMKELLHSLGLGTNVSAGLIAVATFVILYLLGIENWLGLSFSVISGLVAGVVIGQATEYYTSQSYRPTQKIAEASQTGPATVIIKGIGTGMISTMIPVVTISVAIMLSYLCANGFDMSLSAKSISIGLYGIGIAAVGMLSTLGITLATDAYGPIADNAGGNAEMSGLGEEVRERTDALDALGNTTAATGKGFAIGSAALTALALLASYIEEIKIAMIRAMENGKQYFDAAGNVFDPTNATTIDFINFFQVNLINPKVLVGAFLGAMAAFLFCGLTMGAVGRAAESMVQEVRRQFREIKGILEGKATPDYGRCVEISTRGAQREMIIPSLLAIVIPIVVGLVLGVAGVLGLLTGGLAAGFTLAVFMSNSGGAWDNAKKMIEEGHFDGKGSENHKATIVGDTVGDPFKDTSGPSLNILIKLMSMQVDVMDILTILVHKNMSFTEMHKDLETIIDQYIMDRYNELEPKNHFFVTYRYIGKSNMIPEVKERIYAHL